MPRTISAYRVCVICGFRAGRKDDGKKKLIARFPLDHDRCSQWVKVIGNEDLAYVPIEKLNELKFVCGDHFQPKVFNRKKSRLKRCKMMKTPITVLQELMVKFSECPEYECVAQSGPQHLAVFEYRCSARGHVVSATARSKKEAKQEAARLMLQRLATTGLAVPPPYAAPAAAPPSAADGDAVTAGPASRSYKALLKELCQEYNLPGPEYTLEGDTGPAHARRFTARGAVGAHARVATATTKKAAQQLAAQQLYQYLRENLARLTQDFVEEDALARAHERAMERYVDAREDAPYRPDLAQRVDHYHLGLLQHIEEDKLRSGAEALEAASPDAEPEAALTSAAAALGLRAEWHSLPAEGGTLTLLRLAPASPPLVFAARSRAQAAAEGLAYLRLTMQFRKSSTD